MSSGEYEKNTWDFSTNTNHPTIALLKINYLLQWLALLASKHAAHDFIPRANKNWHVCCLLASSHSKIANRGRAAQTQNVLLPPKVYLTLGGVFHLLAKTPRYQIYNISESQITKFKETPSIPWNRLLIEKTPRSLWAMFVCGITKSPTLCLMLACLHPAQF